MAGTSHIVKATRGVRSIAVDRVVFVIDESVLVRSAGGEVSVGTAHGSAGESRATTEGGGRMNIAKRMSLVTMIDKVVLAVKAGVGAAAVVLIEARSGG